MSCRSDAAEAIKAAVSMEDAARAYGYEPTRAGYIRCPFHDEKTASLKIYPGGRGWHCFGCGRGGSVIDFVMELFGLDFPAALRRLDMDFSLGLDLERPPSREERKKARHRREISEAIVMFEDWRRDMLMLLGVAFREGWLALKEGGPEQWTEAQTLAVRWMAALEYWSDTLSTGEMDEQMDIFRDRKELESLCSQILSDTPPKSATG